MENKFTLGSVMKISETFEKMRVALMSDREPIMFFSASSEPVVNYMLVIRVRTLYKRTTSVLVYNENKA